MASVGRREAGDSVNGSREASIFERALETVSREELVHDVSQLVRIPSVTGDERRALEMLHDLGQRLGLSMQTREYDLAEVRATEGYPGEQAQRESLVNVIATISSDDAGSKRLCLNGHIDVVPADAATWTLDPWSGEVVDGRVWGRGSVDMKGSLVVGLHAMAALKNAGWSPPGDLVMQIVSSEEDGGLGTFAALLDDDHFGGAIIPEPTGLAVVCAHAGSLQFEGTVRGRAAHAALRKSGVSAIDRYLPLHHAIRKHERDINSRVEETLLRSLPLPCPIEVGELRAGRWASEVPDELRFAGRLGVPIGTTPADARRAFELALEAAMDDKGPQLALDWRGSFAPSATPANDPLVGLACKAVATELGSSVTPSAVSWGADMQHFRAHGIPCVMFGPTGIERAHAVDESVDVDELFMVARILLRLVIGFWNL